MSPAEEMQATQPQADGEDAERCESGSMWISKLAIDSLLLLLLRPCPAAAISCIYFSNHRAATCIRLFHDSHRLSFLVYLVFTCPYLVLRRLSRVHLCLALCLRGHRLFLRIRIHRT